MSTTKLQAMTHTVTAIGNIDPILRITLRQRWTGDDAKHRTGQRWTFNFKYLINL